MFFGIFRVKNETYIKRLAFDAALGTEIGRVMDEQYRDFFYDGNEELPIEDFYPGSTNSCEFISRIEFDDPYGMINAVDSSAEVAVCNPNEDLRNLVGVFGQVTGGSGGIAIQLIESRRILLPKSGWLIFRKICSGEVRDAVKTTLSPVSSGTFIESDELGLQLDGKLVAAYDGKYLYFKSYYQANRVFDLSYYLLNATDETIREFLSLGCIDDGGNPQGIIENLTRSQRRRVAQVMALGFVKKYSALEIVNRAKSAKGQIPIELSSNGKIKIPERSNDRATLFQFLANGIMSSYLDDETDYAVESMRPYKQAIY